MIFDIRVCVLGRLDWRIGNETAFKEIDPALSLAKGLLMPAGLDERIVGLNAYSEAAGSEAVA